jgi:hypothetical protein
MFVVSAFVLQNFSETGENQINHFYKCIILNYDVNVTAKWEKIKVGLIIVEEFQNYEAQIPER